MAAACGRGFSGPIGSAKRRGQRLARQHQIDRPARVRHRHLHRTRDQVADLVGLAQLVIPFHQLAQHAGLIEHFLRPVDGARARAERTLFGDRRSARSKDQRHAVARKIDQVVDGIGGADVDMHHHRLRTPGHQISAVRHADREVFVRHQNRFRHLGVGLLGAGEGFDDGREVGAGIAEEVIDAVIGKPAQEGLGGDRPFAPSRCDGHAFRP